MFNTITLSYHNNNLSKMFVLFEKIDGKVLALAMNKRGANK